MAHDDPASRLATLDEQCARHQFEGAIGRCRQCGHAFCGECLVFSFGAKQPPFCIPCALSAAGVRSTAARPPAMSKKDLKKRQKEEAARLEREQAAVAEAAAAPIDWSLPVNGTDPNQDPGFPRFEDGARPTNPEPPAPTKGRSLFGRKKNKVVPF